MEIYYCVIRDIDGAECPWLDAPVSAGAIVRKHTGATYGCVSNKGTAIRFVSDGPFCEIHRDALLQVSGESMKAWL